MRHLLWGLLALFTSVNATELRLSGNETSVPLAPLVEAFQDTSAAMSIEDVLVHGRFMSQPELLHSGFTKSAIWLSLTLVNTSANTLTRWVSIQPSLLQEVSFFTQQTDRWQRLDAGNHQQFKTWPIASVHPVFPVQLPPQASQTVYLRIAGTTPIMIEPTLWEPVAFREAENHTRLVDGLLLEGLMVMTIMAMLLLIMFRDRAFLFNALATLSYCLGEASAKGYSFMYLWPEATHWATQCLPLFALLGVGLNILFLRDLLITHRNFPRIDRGLLALLTLQWLPAFGILFWNSPIWAAMSFSLNLPATLVMLTVGAYTMLKGVHAARYYTAAYTLLSIGSLSHALALTGVSSLSWISEYGLPITMILSNAFMMASVVDRVMQIRKEKEIAQQALLTALAAHEAQLEQAVDERTADLNTALVETRKAKQTQSRLVAYIGHDLRAPLATIINYVQLLGQRGDKETQRYQATIERSAIHQLELIDDLVEYARGEQEHLELVLAPTYLHNWLNDIAGQAELLAVQYDNRFSLEVSGQTPSVAVFDPKRLRQVLINLLQNAAKFTSGGEIRLCINAAPFTKNQVELNFAVVDTGPGIPQEDIERMFLPFERRNSEREGSGLGLSIARKLVHAMGSELTADSTPDKGCRFSFRLTVDTAEEADVPYAMQAFVFPEPFGTGKTLLVADDNPASRDYLHEVLSTADFQITVAQDGEEALQKIKTQRFDAVLVDQFMPRMSGWEILRKLHETHPDVAPPVVLCSVMPLQRPEEFPTELNFDAHLFKPIGADMLLQTLQALFNQTPPSVKIPADILIPLYKMIADGCITDIEEWAISLEDTHAQYTAFARRIRDAAQRVALDELSVLLGEASGQTL